MNRNEEGRALRRGATIGLTMIVLSSCARSEPEATDREVADATDDVRAGPDRIATRVVGRLEAVYEDDFTHPDRSGARYFVNEDATGPDRPGSRFELDIHGDPPSSLRHGARARISGTRVGEDRLELDLTSGGKSPSDSAVQILEPAITTISGEQRTLVLIGNSADQSVPCSVSSVEALMFGGGTSVATFYRESSSDTLSFTGAVFGPFSVPSQSSGTCDTSAWQVALDRAAVAAGINLGAYTRHVYVIPQGTCGFAGLGSVGGSPSSAWIVGACDIADVYAHELGHNLGLLHSGTPTSEYGDLSCTMGYGGVGLRHFNAPHQLQLGWIPPPLELSSSGDLHLGGLDSSDPTQALRLTRPSSDPLYVAYRAPIGLDATQLPLMHRNHVTIHSWAGGNAKTSLLASLALNESYLDPVSGTVISFLSTDATGARVHTELKCTAHPPGLELAPATQGGAPGSTLRYIATVRNTDALGCEARSFEFSAVPPTGFSVVLAQSQITLTPGAAMPIDVDVTAPASAASGASPFEIQVRDDGTTVAAQTGTFVVDASPPTVPTNLSGTANRREITLTWAASSDDVSVSGYAVTRNGARIATVSGTRYADRDFTLGQTYSYAVQAFDAAGHFSESSNTMTITPTKNNRRR